MKSFHKLVLPLLLALAAGPALHAEDPVLELTYSTLAPGVYKAYYLGNPNATYPCAHVPANNCQIIVTSSSGQGVDAISNTIGPVAAVKPSTNPAWVWEAVTTQGNTMFMEESSPSGE